MKKISVIFITFLVIFLAGCASVSFANAVLLNTPDGKKIAIQIIYDETRHDIAVEVCYLDKCYSCDAIYDKEAMAADITVSVDTNAIEKTGAVEVEYKNQRYQCRIKN